MHKKTEMKNRQSIFCIGKYTISLVLLIMNENVLDYKKTQTVFEKISKKLYSVFFACLFILSFKPLGRHCSSDFLLCIAGWSEKTFFSNLKTDGVSIIAKWSETNNKSNLGVWPSLSAWPLAQTRHRYLRNHGNSRKLLIYLDWNDKIGKTRTKRLE